MKKVMQGSLDTIKSLYGLPREDVVIVKEFTENLTLEEAMLNNLQWAKEFMDAYERKHKNIRIRK